MIHKALYAALFTSICTVGVAAGQGTTSPPQTTTPQQTNAQSRSQIVLSGCVGQAPMSTASTTGAMTSTTRSYQLNQLQWGAGTAGTSFDTWMQANPRPGSTASANSSTRPSDLRLYTATGSSLDLSKYAGQSVEVTGSLGWPAGTGMMGTATGGTGRTGGTGGQTSMQSQWPQITVASVRVLSEKCREF